MPTQPNILVLMTDQHRPDFTGFGGNVVIQTPHLDALAARSVQFDNAYVANPICMPNRASIFTGRMPSLHGTRYNGIPLDPRARTFPQALKEAGYRTAHIGKCHLQNMGSSPEQLARALPELPSQDARMEGFSEGWDRYEDVQCHTAGYVSMPNDYYGFEHVDLLVGHADSCTGHYYHWAKERGYDISALRGAKNSLELGSPAQHVWRTAVPEEVYPTTYITECMQAYLAQHQAERNAEPFFAVCSYPDPHHPFTPPGRYFDMYAPDDIPLPMTFADPHERSTPQYKRMLKRRGQPLRTHVNPFSPTETEYREMAAKAYGMVSMVDAGIGRILTALEETGLADNTIVVFTADHGDMFGDHGVMLKGGMHYDGCIKVPLLISTPDSSHNVCSALVGSLDIAPTILSLANVERFHGMQGKDLTALIENPQTTVRESILIEEDQVHDIVHVGHSLRMRTVVTKEGRLTLYDGLEHGELFDRTSDPDECRNLFGLPEAVELQLMMTQRLASEMMAHADHSPRPSAFA